MASWCWPCAGVTPPPPDRYAKSTATHYEVLGVAPDASHDEVKRAFLDQALRFHPDRLSESSPEARERAEFRMREINAAWGVLRSPMARGEYDAELRESRRRMGSAPTSGTPVADTAYRPAPSTASNLPPIRLRPVWADPDEIADLAPAAAAPVAAPVRTPRWVVWGPIIVGSVVGFALLIAAVTSSRSADPGVKVETVDAFAVGTCVAVVNENAVTGREGSPARPVAISTSCSQPNDGRIVSRMPFPRPCPTGTRALVLVVQRESLCLS